MLVFVLRMSNNILSIYFLTEKRRDPPNGKLFNNYWSKNFRLLFNPCRNKYHRHCAQLLQSCPTLCNPMDCRPPGFSVHGIFQTRKLEWVAVSFSRGSSNRGIEPKSLTSRALAARFFITSATWEAPSYTLIPTI